MDPSTELRFVEQAVRLATENGATGQLPFGAVVVRAGEVIATGVNTTLRDHDPTAHAEVAAVRAACRALGTTALPGAVVVSSCEPCPVCHVVAVAAGVQEIVYAATAEQAAAHGFASPVEVIRIREDLAELRRVHLRHIPTGDDTAPFVRYRASNPGGSDGPAGPRP